MLGQAPAPEAAAGLPMRLKCEGLDVMSFGATEEAPGDEVWTAVSPGPSHWRVLWRNGQVAGGLYVGAVGGGKAFAQALQAPMDRTALKQALSGL